MTSGINKTVITLLSLLFCTIGVYSQAALTMNVKTAALLVREKALIAASKLPKIKYFLKESADNSFIQINSDGSSQKLPLLRPLRLYGNQGYASVFEAIPGITYTEFGFKITPDFQADSLSVVLSAIMSRQDRLKVSAYRSQEEWREAYIDIMSFTEVSKKALVDNFVFELPASKAYFIGSTTGVYAPNVIDFAEGELSYHGIYDPANKLGIVAEEDQHWRNLDPGSIWFSKKNDENVETKNLSALFVCALNPGTGGSRRSVYAQNSSILLSVDIKEILVYDKTSGVIYGRVHV